MANLDRLKRVREQIRRDLSVILPETVFHPQITFISITGVYLSRDLKFADIAITIIANDQAKRDEMLTLLNDHKTKIRTALSKKMTTRTVPMLTFVYDDTVEYGARMDKMLTDLTRGLKDDDKPDED